MATFTVHVPPGIGDEARRADGTVFVRDGFSVAAFLFGPLVLLYRRLWGAALAWVAAVGAMMFVAHVYDFPLLARTALFLVLAVLTGLEAGEARRRALGRRGYIPSALLTGVSREAGERQFFAHQPPTRPLAAPSGRAPGRMDPPDASRSAVIGLFPQPGDGMPMVKP